MKAAFHILVSGFTQNRGYVHGILRLRETLLEQGFSNGLRHRVWYLPWTSNYERVAQDLVHVCAMHGLKPLVSICGYSYGGWGAVRLCRHLEKAGVSVQYLVLSDPVARPWYWPRPLPALTSMLGRNYSHCIEIPSNVAHVHSFYQTMNRPQGHILRANGPSTIIHPAVKLHYTHQKMDDSLEFHSRVIKYAEFLRQSVNYGVNEGAKP